jgi:hypothetical protein
VAGRPRGGVAHVAPLSAFAAEAHRAGLSDVYLLGMGGSSLCAEALRDIGAAGRAECRLTVIDTTDEHTIRQITSALKPARSLFIVASKSGSTIEVDSLERHFWADDDPSRRRCSRAVRRHHRSGHGARKARRRKALSPRVRESA